MACVSSLAVRRCLVFAFAFVNVTALHLDGPVSATERRALSGPIPAVVERVIDGDTVDVRAQVWLGMEMRVRVRLADIEAPELRSRCEIERFEAAAVRDWLASLLEGSIVELRDIRAGKYHGRVIANIVGPDGQDVGHRLRTHSRVARYGTRRRCRSCDAQEVCRRYFGMVGVAISGR